MSDNHVDVSFKSFGKPFQERILQALLSDHSWSQQMMEVMRPEYFEVKHLRYLFEVYSKHYQTYKTFPSLVLLASMVRDQLRDGNDLILCSQIVKYLDELKNNPNMNDLPYVKDCSLDFCKTQALKEALEKAIDYTKEKRFEEIVACVKEAVVVGTPSTTGHDFFEDFEARFTQENRIVIPTGIPQLDAREIMNGGLGAGEIGIIMSPTGGGKSHFLVQIGANALRLGLNVLHYTFELSEHKVGIRYDSNLTGVSATDIYDEKQFINEHYSKNKYGKLIIKDYPTNTATVNTLKAHIEKLAVTKGFKPNVILIDYADIMRSTRQYDSLRHELKLIYEELRGLAMELQLPIWSASQTNRESTESDVLGIDKISESFGKAMVCDFIISLSRKPIHKAKGLCNLFIPKNRLGKDGILFPATIDTARSMIKILDQVVDIEEFERNANANQKQLLRERWNEVAEDRMFELRNINKKVSNGGEEV